MSTTKAALKAINASIQGAKFDEAVQQAQQLLLKDSVNYQANIFLGFALDKQNKTDEAEKAYDAASRIKPDELPAWQGLIKLYEKQGNNKLDRYQNAAAQLALLYGQAEDMYKCQDVVDKFVGFAKKHGTSKQERQALHLHLPDGPLYRFLEGRVPAPAHTYESIAKSVEQEEKERTNKEIGERRTRLGAKIQQVTLDVKRDILKDSPLEALYRQIIDWSQDDEVRRSYEEKLLLRCYDALLVVPASQKSVRGAVVEQLARDMVIIRHPYKLAWDLHIEWQDHERIENWDVHVLRDYQAFFPESGLARLLLAYMSSEISPFPKLEPAAPRSDTRTTDDTSDESSDDDAFAGVSLGPPINLEDRIIMMNDGLSDAPTSLLAYRMMSAYYEYLEEHQSLVEIARAGLLLASSEATKIGLPFARAHQDLTTLLATGLVYMQSPRHHPEAKALFDGILQLNPRATSALIGVGLIYEEEEDYPAAVDFLTRALARDPSNIRVRSEAAWVKALNGNYSVAEQELEECLEQMEATTGRGRELRAQTQYRIGMCKWNVDTSSSARKDRSGPYAMWLAALKSNLNYAPAYTSLGIFYNDYSKDKKRARKCFQKAFELSASEVDAAERLARAFAEQGEWELVEAVAQRVVESGKVRPAPGSKKKGISWPFAALGIAELNKQDYAKSIISFQSALRISPNDYHCWVGLGESYHNSGRYIAATKAFTHAEQFEYVIEQETKGETWFAKYMLANVKRELGEYSDSILGYRAVLAQKPREYGVSIALIQTLVDSAWDSIVRGMYGHAIELASEAISEACSLAKAHDRAFNLWKSLGDACTVFSWVQSKLGDFPGGMILRTLSSDAGATTVESVDDVDEVRMGSVDEVGRSGLAQCLQLAILCHKRAIRASAVDVHAQAVAYYNLGWTEYRAHGCLAHTLEMRINRYQKASVRCFKRAIELEAGNSEFWNALGIVTSQLAPQIAQHSFVRSLYINERSAHAWTNLGTLYLLQNDLDLAHETFGRAQSTDPDFAHAWLGQGLVSLLSGNATEARLIFEHAMEISDSSSTIVRKQYAVSTFDHIMNSITKTSIVELIHPIFGLDQVVTLLPNELAFQHLSSLFLEQVKDVSAALATLNNVSSKIEADYEITESAESLSRFVLAKADFARLCLADGDNERAIENAETAIELSAEDAGSELSADARRKCRLSAHLTLGLATYHSGDASEAIQYLEAAIEESKDDPDCVCMLAQVLWATNTKESRKTARNYLLDVVEKHKMHIRSVLLLATIALLENDTKSLSLAMADLTALRTDSTTTEEEQAHIVELLRAAATLSPTASETSILAQTQTEVFMFPDQPYGWGRLEDAAAADMALKTAVRSVPPRGKLEAQGLGAAYGGTGKVADAQKGIFVAPWTRQGWHVLEGMVRG